ncbi:complex III assembly factor LYRM7 [Ptiloglossa arizonensis]|uniref:complex III assembly factor LYRM7 n=1 Tax=Ptiloglossa arizonensis TaxID=3350558 RepID=UPI003F9F6059
MGDNLRRQVLHTFKKLHRTRMNTFQDDEHTLKVVRDKINEEYKKYKNITNTTIIEELNKFAQEVEHEVRTTIIQAVKTESGNFELRIRPEVLTENLPTQDPQVTQNNSNLKRISPKDKPKNSS